MVHSSSFNFFVSTIFLTSTASPSSSSPFIVGLSLDPSKFFLFYVFTALAFAVFTFTGQMLMSLVRDAQTAQGLGGVVVTCTSLFSGVLINPNEIPNFWIWVYWVFAGHWIFEGIFMSQFEGDDTFIEANPSTTFYSYSNCTGAGDEYCGNTAEVCIFGFPATQTTPRGPDAIPLTLRLLFQRPRPSFVDRCGFCLSFQPGPVTT